ncbi:hypothetical protein EI94DRAFT_1662921 [Lactarius quietus]|nr:hypothetical protein EI94DRAFT_1662921 [Lactarius quietus]
MALADGTTGLLRSAHGVSGISERRSIFPHRGLSDCLLPRRGCTHPAEHRQAHALSSQQPRTEIVEIMLHKPLRFAQADRWHHFKYCSLRPLRLFFCFLLDVMRPGYSSLPLFSLFFFTALFARLLSLRLFSLISLAGSGLLVTGLYLHIQPSDLRDFLQQGERQWCAANTVIQINYIITKEAV